MSDIPEPMRALLTIWPDDLAAVPGQAASGTCIESSKLAHRVMARFGVRTKVVACDVWMGNRHAVPHREKPLNEWPADAWSVGVQSGTGPLVGKAASQAEPHRKQGFNGHVILIADSWLADMTAAQFDRPRHGIDVKGAIVLGGLEGLLEKNQTYEIVVNLSGGGEAVYRTRPDIASFRKANAWRDDGGVQQIVDILHQGVLDVLAKEAAAAGG